jgi:hypothetical protein
MVQRRRLIDGQLTAAAMRFRLAGSTTRCKLSAAAVLLGVIGALTGCGSSPPEIHGPQLDIVLRTQMGSGDEVSAPNHFPHARYTFFAFEDPTLCLSGVQLLDSTGSVVGGETVNRQAELPAMNVPTPLVQRNLPEADYRLRITTEAPRCTWMVQEVLNSMSTQAAPPTAETAPAAPRFAATVDQQTTVMNIPKTGLYSVGWSITIPPNTNCPYVMSLRTSTGDVEAVNRQPPESGVPVSPSGPPPAGGGSDQGTVFLLLADGARTVSAVTPCPWQLSIAPLIGPNGGGVRGFQ